MTKLKRSALYISNYASLFKCPICASTISVSGLKSLVCTNNHTFDIARQGYINLLSRQIRTNYSRELFEARRKVIADSGFFDTFNNELSLKVNENTSTITDITMIDMGSGEGSHLNNIKNTLQSQFNKDVVAIGIDISREGILEAAKHYENPIWLVADLASAPLQDDVSDVIINILSPSNYTEFNRLLKSDGIVVKVVPRKNYLKELRQQFYKESDKKEYSNARVINHFKDNFELIDQTKVQYTEALDESSLKALVHMTPLTWNITTEKIERFLESSKYDMTVDLDILIGKKMR